MAGTVYLRTNRFEVKLEGITFKTKVFESLCKMDFLFPNGKVWARPPIVGLDVMRHPRDPSILLLLLCFGIGCVILRFSAGETLSASIHRFFADKRVHFVGFGIPEKKDLFPFEALGLTKYKVDIGYLAAKILKDSKYKRCELAELARKVLGIKRMIGLTEASTSERHEQIKCAICQLFITSVIAMGLLGANDKKKSGYFSKTGSFLKNLNSLHLLAEGWFKLPKRKKKKHREEEEEEEEEEAARDNIRVHIGKMQEDNNVFGCKKSPFVDCFVDAEFPEGDSGNYSPLAKIKEVAEGSKEEYWEDCEKSKKSEGDSSDDSGKEVSCAAKKPLKGILKCPSTTLMRCNSLASPSSATPPSPSTSTSTSTSTPSDQTAAGGTLRRANSKGYNVSFKFH